MSYDVFTGALQMFDDFQGVEAKIQYLSHSSLAVLNQRYFLNEIAGEGNTFDRANRLLVWLAARVCHKGDYDSSLTNAIDLLDYSLDKGLESGINCLSLSVALTEMCLSVGIFARRMSMMPLSPYDGDNHVVCEVWLPEEQRWVMMDPSYGGFVTDENGKSLSLLSLRQILGSRGEVRFSDHFAGNRTLYLTPIGYDPIRSQLTCIDYKIKTFGPHLWFDNKKKALRQEEALFCSESVLTAVPVNSHLS